MQGNSGKLSNFLLANVSFSFFMLQPFQIIPYVCASSCNCPSNVAMITSRIAFPLPPQFQPRPGLDHRFMQFRL
jgi:hypothetical protein